MRATYEILPKFSDHVLVDGAFDPLHAGHVAYLQSAASYGPLLCSVASDDQMREQGKIPLLPQEQRVAVMEALGCISAVYAKDRPTEQILAQMRPAAYVKGCDWVGKLPEAQIDVCDRYGIPIHYTKTPKDSSGARLQAWALASADRSLENLERAIAEQQAHRILPWEPVTDYSFEARKAIEGPHAELIWDAFQPCSILDVGCGPGHLVRLLKGLRDGAHVCGIDLAKPTDDNEQWYEQCDITEPDVFVYSLSAGTTDLHELVICREVLEHLTVRQIPIAVRNMFRLSSKFVYITTRFSAHGIFDVGTEFEIDPTHISLLSQPFLRSLCVLNGGTRRRDLEMKLDWQNKGRVLVYEVSR